MELISLVSYLIGIAVFVWFLIRVSKRDPDAFNKWNPYYKGGIKNPKIQFIVLCFACVIFILKLIFMLTR